MKTSASYSISKLYDGDKTFVLWGVSNSNILIPEIWSNSEPIPQANIFIWRKEGQGLEEASAIWGNPVCLTGSKGDPGPRGPAGTPGYIGAYSNEATLYVKGFDADGILQASVGYIYVGSQRITVNEYSQTLTNDGRGYIIFDGTTIKFAQLIANSSGSNWVVFNATTTVIDGTFYVLGTFNKSGNSIFNINIFNPIVKQDYEQQYFMDILANGNLEDVNTWAAASGINTVVEKIAILEAFINTMFANQIKLMSGGVIYSDYYNPDGSINENSTAEEGSYLGANGLAKLRKAILEEVILNSGSFISDEFSTQKAGNNPATIIKSITSNDYTHSRTSIFFDAIKSKCFNTGTIINGWYTSNITGNYKEHAFSQVASACISSKSLTAFDWIAFDNNILYLGHLDANEIPYLNYVNLSDDKYILSTETAYADYSADSWHIEAVPSFVPGYVIVADFLNDIPSGANCLFSGTVTIYYNTKSFTLTNGKVLVNDTSLSFFDTNNNQIGIIYNSSDIKSNTNINISVQASLPGITSMNITPHSNNNYDIGQSNKVFRKGYFSEIFADTINLNGQIMSGIIDSHHFGSEWYVKFSNGFWIRGGFVYGGTSSFTVSLSPPMASVTYSVLTSTTNYSNLTYEWSTTDLTTSSFKIYRKYSDRDIRWIVMGY